jgi:hypothetical protein
MNSMHVLIQRQNGWIGNQLVGEAVVDADLDASLTKLALRRGCEPLARFTVCTPRQASDVTQVLEALGDVEVSSRDFEAQWFDPKEGIATVENLLQSRARCLTTSVRAELVFLRRELLDAAGHRSRFHLVEVDSEKGVAGEGLLSLE